MTMHNTKSLLLAGILGSLLLVGLGYFNSVPTMVAVVLWLLGIPVMAFSLVWVCFLVLLRDVRTESILKGLRYNLVIGFTMLFTGISMLIGVYVRSMLEGKLEVKFILFWPMITAACVMCCIGIYRKVIRKNVTNFETWEHLLDRKDSDPIAFMRRFLDDVILQNPLRRLSLIRWLRHILIYWGFVLLWASDMTFALINDYLPVFGITLFTLHQNPVRLALDLSMDFFGMMVLAGTAIALIQRYRLRGTEEIIYSDTPTAAFLFVVAATGYVVEAFRLAALPYDQYMSYSFVGNYMASFLRSTGWASGENHHALWIFHAVLACAFIAYFPVKRLIHSCAAPVGKLMQSQNVLLESKLNGVVSGLLQREEAVSGTTKRDSD